MFRPIALYIGLRYTRAKKRNHFISFISLTSMLGIALGVAVLITVLSVMNGFDDVIRERTFAMAPQVTVTSAVSGGLTHWQGLRERLAHHAEVVDVAPYINGEGLLSSSAQVNPAMLIGVLPDEERKVSQIANKLIAGSFNALKPGRFGIVIGQKLANNLGLSLGDKVVVATTRAAVTPAGVMPIFKRFTVVGIFKVGSAFLDFDGGVAFIQLNDAQKFLQFGDAITGLRLKLTKLYDAPKVAASLAKQLPDTYQISNWTEQIGYFFEAIKLEKTMIFLMLMLIIAVAAFNMVSTLVMVVTEKKADIAILRTLGATPQTIMGIFMVQGSVIGIIGTLLGLVGGVFLAHHVTEFVNALQHIFHVQLISSDVYFVDYLPSKLESADVINICTAALLMSLLATIYPAWHASRTQPAEALRYE